MIVIAFISIVLYAWFIYKSITGWKLLYSQNFNNQAEVKISVIIAARNEASNLPALLMDIEQQSFSKNNFEVLLIDDHSSDNTPQLISEFQHKVSYKLKYVQLKNESGKKAAITEGLTKAEYDLLVTTDADCRIKSSWLEIYANYFHNVGAKFVAGPVCLKASKNLFEILQKFEFSILNGVTAAFFGLKRPIMCNGANLGFTRSLFEEVKGYQEHENIPSGEDVFLLHQAKSLYPDEVYYLLDERAVVSTNVKTSFTEFMQQRLRWASKSKFYKDNMTISVAAIITFINLLIVFFALVSFASFQAKLILLTLYLSKWIMDIFFIWKIKRFFKIKKPFMNSFLLSLLFPFYSVGVAILSLIIHPKWKGRKI